MTYLETLYLYGIIIICTNRLKNNNLVKVDLYEKRKRNKLKI